MQDMSSRSQVNKSNKNHYPRADTDIVDDRLITAQAKLAYLVDTMDG
jgi:hypothetical protein